MKAIALPNISRAAAEGDHAVMPAGAQHRDAGIGIGAGRIGLHIGIDANFEARLAQQLQRVLRHRQIDQPRIGDE